jgi:2-polyprenyl-3-methyl-5-hydroxy-6-metoxy-1,4-benzoquinol methylase
LKGRGLSPELILANPEKITSFGEQKFDMVFGLEVFEHLKKPTEQLREILKNLNYGAYILLSGYSETTSYGNGHLEEARLDYQNFKYLLNTICTQLTPYLWIKNK